MTRRCAGNRAREEGVADLHLKKPAGERAAALLRHVTRRRIYAGHRESTKHVVEHSPQLRAYFCSQRAGLIPQVLQSQLSTEARLTGVKPCRTSPFGNGAVRRGARSTFAADN